MKTELRKYAEELIARKKVSIEIGDRQIAIAWEDDNLQYGMKRFEVKDFFQFEVRAYREKLSDEIAFGLIVRSYSHEYEVLAGDRDPERLFEVGDMIDNLIVAAKFAVKPSENACLLASKMQDAAERISQGKATLNQVREEFGLARIETESMDELYVLAAKV